MATRKKKVKAKSKSSRKAAPKKKLAAKRASASKKKSAPKKKATPKPATKSQPKEGDIVSTQQMAIAEIVGDIEERMALDRLTATVE